MLKKIVGRSDRHMFDIFTNSSNDSFEFDKLDIEVTSLDDVCELQSTDKSIEESEQNTVELSEVTGSLKDIEITDNLEEVRDNLIYSDVSPEFEQEVRRDIKKSFLEEEMNVSDSIQLKSKAFYVV